VLREQLQQSALRGLAIFAGDGKVSGYIAVTRFLEQLPAAEQEKAADIFMKILNGSLWELWQAARARTAWQRWPATRSMAASCNWPSMRWPMRPSIRRRCSCN
jgi:cytochrome c biogenesis protein ResB